MAFNNRKLQKLIEEESKAADFVDEFEDDFDDDFDAPEEAEAVGKEAEEAVEEAPQEEVQEAPAEEIPEEVPEIAEEPVIEEIVEEETAAEPEAEAEPVIIAEEPAKAEEYDAHKMWQDMAGLAIKAKKCIKDGAFFRANDIVTVMRSMLVEMMCRSNGINENFNDNVDNLDDTCRQEIYTSYVASLNAQTLTDVVTHIMTVTYKYI